MLWRNRILSYQKEHTEKQVTPKIKLLHYIEYKFQLYEISGTDVFTMTASNFILDEVHDISESDLRNFGILEINEENNNRIESESKNQERDLSASLNGVY